MSVLHRFVIPFLLASLVTVIGVLLSVWLGLELRFLTGWAAGQTFMWGVNRDVRRELQR